VRGNRTDGSREGNVLARKIVFFLMVGVFVGALTGLAVADFTGEVPQGAAEEEEMNYHMGIHAP